jgi:hypothetical protein
MEVALLMAEFRYGMEAALFKAESEFGTALVG